MATQPARAREQAQAEHFDVLIVGAGISGIGAAHHLQRRLPGKSYAILEAREAIGGTWDLFRYPGIRSDSDMHTLGYRFRPWRAAKAIADGPAILRYVRETAREDGSERHIRFGHRVDAARWSSAEARWTVHATRLENGQAVRFTCAMLLMCSGYYRYDAGYTPPFEGVEGFRGALVHPQHWPADLDYAGRRIVVIGSGATAVTLVPALARRAAHVTMLQRSPSYIVSIPGEDPLAKGARRLLGERAAYALTRWKNVLMQALVYQLSRRRPRLVRALVRAGVRRRLPDGYDVDTHFKPSYEPWDQRLCVVPDADLFEAIGSGRASVVTDHIERFTERGIALRSGRELQADVIVTATGLNLLVFGGVELSVDGRPVDLAQSVTYKGMMLSGVPNFAFTLGYTNASWTLKADLVSEYVCRVLAHMQRHGHEICVPEHGGGDAPLRPLLDLDSGYVRRSIDALPRQGERAPWRMRMSYAHDLLWLRYGSLHDGAMRFASPPRAVAPAPEPTLRVAA